ncbi:MAG: SOS response-associated peptidase family protein [Lachnospiraceae bacterium]|nr:SOS response-associated peptidase family protein [Lachnospiraceae bacterium]
MCTRYYMEMSPELRPIVETAKRSSLAGRMIDKLGKPLKTDGEIRPTDMVPVIAPDKNGNRAVFPMVWGYRIPGLNRPVVNARVETASKKDVWKDGWDRHRCIIPASWYFEWEHIPTADGKTKTGRKYLIQPKGSSLIFLAGLYRIEEFQDLKYPVFSVLTKQPTEELKKIHDRMPLMLPANIINDWISPNKRADDLVRYAQTDVFIETAP